MQGLSATLFPAMLVSDVMDKWPQTTQVFVRLRMACPGCPVARFHTLAEVAAEYQMDPAILLKELQDCVDSPPSDDSVDSAG
jgi:hybrid cluster-associated redox disulfide protein